MIKLTDILLRERKVLSVFDFDDTLAKADAWIYVQQGGRTIMGVPAMSPSNDFQTRTGYSTSTGVVTMTVTKDGWDNLKIL